MKKVENMPVMMQPRITLEPVSVRSFRMRRRHDRVGQPRLQDDEGGEQPDGDAERGQGLRSSSTRRSRPARSRRCPTIRDRVTSTEPTTSTPCLIPRPTFSTTSMRPRISVAMPIGHIHEEDPVPAQCLGQHTAGEEAHGTATHGDEDVGAHGLGPLDRGWGTRSR